VRNNPECVGRYSFIQYIASAVCYRFQGPLNTGRYLGIRTEGRQILQLCEVEVYSRGINSYQSELQKEKCRVMFWSVVREVGSRLSIGYSFAITAVVSAVPLNHP